MMASPRPSDDTQSNAEALALDAEAFERHVRQIWSRTTSPCVLDISEKTSGSFPVGAFELVRQDLTSTLGEAHAAASLGALEEAGMSMAASTL